MKVRSLIISVILIGLLIIPYLLLYAHFQKTKRVMNDFCIEYGYNKCTDYYIDITPIPTNYNVECDNKTIFKNLYMGEKCTEYNKFDKCIAFGDMLIFQGEYKE